MIVQFSINPMDSEHISEDISRITAFLDEAGVDYTVGPIGTSVQGEWDSIMPIIRQCHIMIAKDHARILTTITIDDHKNKEHSLRSSIESSVHTADNTEYINQEEVYNNRGRADGAKPLAVPIPTLSS